MFAAWLRGSLLRREDGVFVFSVGGGSVEQNISPNLVRALAFDLVPEISRVKKIVTPDR